MYRVVDDGGRDIFPGNYFIVREYGDDFVVLQPIDKAAKEFVLETGKGQAGFIQLVAPRRYLRDGIMHRIKEIVNG